MSGLSTNTKLLRYEVYSQVGGEPFVQLLLFTVLSQLHTHTNQRHHYEEVLPFSKGCPYVIGLLAVRAAKCIPSGPSSEKVSPSPGETSIRYEQVYGSWLKSG